jgi:hypothetical protein
LNFYYNNARKIFKLGGSEGGDFSKEKSPPPPLIEINEKSFSVFIFL